MAPQPAPQDKGLSWAPDRISYPCQFVENQAVSSPAAYSSDLKGPLLLKSDHSITNCDTGFLRHLITSKGLFRLNSPITCFKIFFRNFFLLIVNIANGIKGTSKLPPAKHIIETPPALDGFNAVLICSIECVNACMERASIRLNW